MYYDGILKNPNTQKQINKLIKKCKNKKVLVYGAGEFSQFLFEKYDLSALDIVAVVDKKYENKPQGLYFNIKTCAPSEISELDFDIIVVANLDFKYFKIQIQELLLNSNHNNIEILPLIKVNEHSFPFKKLFNIFYALINPEEFSIVFLKTISFLGSMHIRDNIKRFHRKKKLYTYFGTRLYGCQVLRTAKSIGEGFYCGGFSLATPKTVLKEHVCFNGMHIRGWGNVTIGRYFHSGPQCMIITQNHDYDNGNAIPYGDSYIYKDVEIGDFVWLGARVTILPGTKIGEGAIIQAGSVVHGEIPPYAIAGGNPAKVFKYRNKEHFDKLKAEGKFH